MPSWTEVGNAERLIDRFGDKIRFCRDQRTWYCWDGLHWVEDIGGSNDRPGPMMTQHAIETSLAIIDEKVSDELEEGLMKWQKASLNTGKIDAMIRLAQSQGNVGIPLADLDSQLDHVNCRNGSVNLETGKLAPHLPANLHTKCLDVEFKAGQVSDIWSTFLRQVFDDDTELIEFVEQAIGYSMSARTSEQCLFFLYGAGQNGKSVFIHTLKSILSGRNSNDGYAVTAGPTVLLSTGATSEQKYDLSRLRGARLLSATENKEGREWNEETVKRITGEDFITAREMYKPQFEFRPICKIWFSSNHRPIVRGIDHAIWRRIRLIPFNRIFSGKARDPELGRKLMEDRDAIFSQMVAGAQRWYQDGLHTPLSIQTAVDSYRHDMDPLSDFLATRVKFAPNAKVKIADLYNRYLAYCKRETEIPIPKRDMIKRLIANPSVTRCNVGRDKGLRGILPVEFADSSMEG